MPKNIRIFYGASFSIFLSACSPSSISASSPLIVIEGPNSQTCATNDIMLSDDGKRFILNTEDLRTNSERDWTRPNSISIVEIHSSGSAVRPNDVFSIKTIHAGARYLDPMLFSDDKLILRAGDSEIVTLQSSEPGKQVSQTIPDPFRGFDLHPRSIQDLALLNDEGLLEKAVSISAQEAIKRRSLFFGDEIVFSSVDTTKGNVLSVSTASGRSLELGSSAMFHDFKAGFHDGEFRTSFLGGSMINLRQQTSIPYQRHIDSSSGSKYKGIYNIAGVFGNFDTSVLNEFIEDLGLNVVSVYSSKAATAILLVGKERTSRYVVLAKDGENPVILDICGGEAFENEMRAISLKTFSSRLARSNGPLPIRLEVGKEAVATLEKGSNSDGSRLIVFFHGGPGISYQVAERPEVISRLLENGYDVLSVEYSGSVGGGLRLSQQLSTEQVFGFDLDSFAIRSWLNRQRYRQVNVLAVSFGAAPAIQFRDRSADIIRRSVFVAPLLALPDPSLSALSGGPLLMMDDKVQLQFELGVFGGFEKRAQFARWIKDRSETIASPESLLLVFGELDEKSPYNKAPTYLRERAQIYIESGSGHAFVGSDPDTTDRILSFVMR